MLWRTLAKKNFFECKIYRDIVKCQYFRKTFSKQRQKRGLII